jgi:transcription initiation factor IIE alpha subunit
MPRVYDDLFNADSPTIKQDIIRMILQYLQDEGYHSSRVTLHDEANCKWHEYEDQQMDMKRMRKAILGKPFNVYLAT